MTKLPKIEKCVCGNQPTFNGAQAVMKYVFCGSRCWVGQSRNTNRSAILAWNAVMRAAKAAELAKRAARRRSQAKAAKKARAK